MRLVEFLTVPGKTELIFTTCFWESSVIDPVIREAAKISGARLVDLSGLGSKDEMKAVGLFEHSGVAAPPGDAGMSEIADRIWKTLRPIL